MNTQINKVTPAHGLSWYLKWLASIVLVHAMAFTALDMYPYNMYLQFVGVLGWFFVGMLWHDRALIVLNAIGLVFLGMGIFKYLNECTNCMIPL
jgi:energy-coupling factor transporter transmembrane protein EcfT|tara:strand:+ start:733 stop:1014 length:282 start_codon:yes stop_codon:yes gene_type:complete